MVLPRLIERLMTIAVQNAGAERGLLILPQGSDYVIEAEARANGDQIEVAARQESLTHVASPDSVVRYVIRAGDRFEMRNRLYQSVIDLLHKPTAELQSTTT